MTRLLIVLHLIGLAVSLGGGLCFLLVFYPALQGLEDRSLRMRWLANAIRYYHPLFLAGICLAFMSGAIHLTQLKIDFGAAYFAQLGKILLWKFGLTLLIFLVAGMQCFGMGMRFGRMAYGVIPGDLALQERYAKKIWRAQAFNLILLLAVLWLGVKLGALIHNAPSP